jgi:hypothetical protein
MLAVVCVAAVLVAAAPGVREASAGPPAQKATSPSVVFVNPPLFERIEIDGRKNPEMIPQWDVWKVAFAAIAKVSDVPTVVIRHLSESEAALVLTAARENGSNALACEARMLEHKATLLTEDARRITEKTQEINIDCRWQTLRLRDRVLAGLGPPGQAALNQWVESIKEGMRVFVSKDDLAFYRQPQ